MKLIFTLTKNIFEVLQINNCTKLIVYESLAILNMRPNVNKQNEDFFNA